MARSLLDAYRNLHIEPSLILVHGQGAGKILTKHKFKNSTYMYSILRFQHYVVIYTTVLLYISIKYNTLQYLILQTLNLITFTTSILKKFLQQIFEP